MKKILSLAGVAMACSSLFIACEDDIDSNPVIVQPAAGSFVVNVPAYAAQDVNLAAAKELPFAWSQPVFTTGNAPILPTYEIQVALTADSKFDVSYDEAKADKSGSLVANYAVLPEKYSKCNVSLSAESIDRAIMHLNGLEEEDAFNTLYGATIAQPVYVRVKASIQNEASKKEAVGGKVYASIVSNVVGINTTPYYVADLDPEIWFITGTGGAGNWDNKADIGGSVIPMSVKGDASYDYNGFGEFVYTGYFVADQFKFVLTPGAWEPMWGLESEGEKGTSKYRDIGGEDPACWKFAAEGYYTLTIKHGKKTQFDVEPALCKDQNPALPAAVSVTVAGAEVAMSQNSHNKHIWYADVTASDKNVSAFLTVDGAKVAGSAFPYGVAEAGATEILVKKPGSYRVVYNDLDKCYLFFAQ